MPSEIVQPNKASIKRAVEILRGGGVVAFATETVYGLGADTLNSAALRKIYELKGRPSDNPLIAHVESVAKAMEIVTGWDARCDALAERFWPGALTMILPKAGHVPSEATAGLGTIAARCPNHPVAMELLQAFGSTISAPSANRSGHISPTEAGHVAHDFAGCAELLILDGGACAVGLESTVVDMTKETARILRPGSVTAEQLRAVLGDVVALDINVQAESPGTAAAHYAPKTPARLVDSDKLVELLEQSKEPVVVLYFDAKRVRGVCATAHRRHEAIVMPSDAKAYAAELYRALRQADAMKLSQIVIERPSGGSEWDAARDRLRRATAG